jgi:hypothetical protein
MQHYWRLSLREAGIVAGVEAVVRVTQVRIFDTKSGNRRYVVGDETGKEYTTFRPPIGEAAAGLEGKRARIEFHEAERNGFQNVYLDAISEVGEEPDLSPDGDEADTVAWKTAIDAAPWLLGNNQPDEPVAPEELYERLKPFKERVADDIKSDG